MRLWLEPLDVSAIGEDDAYALIAAMNDIETPLIPFLLTFEVVGPAEFFEVVPYTWGRDGRSDLASPGDPIKRLTCDSGQIGVAVLLQADLVDEIKVGVIWKQPWQRGLETGAVRLTLESELEEWQFFSRARRYFSRHGESGRWRRKTGEKVSFGPVSQPWEHPKLKKAR